MAFDLTYNGIPFRLPARDLLAKIEDWARLEDSRETDRPLNPFPAPNLSRLGIARPTVPSWLKIFDYYNPVGASQWGVFRGLAHRDDVDAMASAALGAGGPAPATLNMQIASETAIQSSMYMLPPKPLVGVSGATDLYLVTLVDERFLWQFKPFQSGHIGFTSYTTWAAFISAILSHLGISGITTTPTAIEAVYDRPAADSDLYAHYENPGVILDAALANIGRIMVRSTLAAPGAYHLLRWSEANTYLATARDAHSDVLIFGGEPWDQDAAVADHRRRILLPASVVVTFPRWTDTYGYVTDTVVPPTKEYRRHSQSESYDSVYSKTVAAASLGSPYSTMPTHASHLAALHTTAKADCTIAGPTATPDNAAALDALAERLAKDFYDAQFPSLDAVYLGVIDFDRKSGLDIVYSYLDANTRVWRRPWNRYQTEFQHGLGSISNTPVRLLVVDDTAHSAPEYVDNVTHLTFAPAETAYITSPSAGKAEVRLLNAGPNLTGLLASAPGFGEPYDGTDSFRINSLYQLVTGTHVFGGLYNGGAFNAGNYLAAIGQVMVVDQNATIPSAGFPNDADIQVFLGTSTYNNFSITNNSGTVTAGMNGVSGANIVSFFTLSATATGGSVVWGAGGSGGAFSFDAFNVWTDQMWLQTVGTGSDFRSGYLWGGATFSGAVPTTAVNFNGVCAGVNTAFVKVAGRGFAVEGGNTYRGYFAGEASGGINYNYGQPYYDLGGALHFRFVYSDNVTSTQVTTPSYGALGQDIIISGTPYVLRGIVVSSSLPPIDLDGGGAYAGVEGVLGVGNGGTGQSSFTAGQVIVGDGANPLAQLTSTRRNGTTLELKIAADRWIAFSKGSF